MEKPTDETHLRMKTKPKPIPKALVLAPPYTAPAELPARKHSKDVVVTPTKSLSMAVVACAFKKSADVSTDQLMPVPSSPRSTLRLRSSFLKEMSTYTARRNSMAFNPSLLMDSIDAPQFARRSARLRRKSARAREWSNRRGSQVHFINSDDSGVGPTRGNLAVVDHQQVEGTLGLEISQRKSSNSSGQEQFPKLNKHISYQYLSSSGKSMISTRGSSRISAHKLIKRNPKMSISMHPLDAKSLRGLESLLKSRVHNPKPQSVKVITSHENTSSVSSKELRTKFAYAIRMIRFMIRLTTCLKFYARGRSHIEDTEQSIEQLNYYSMETEFTTEKLVFSKANFAATNVIYVPPWAQYVLSKPPSERTNKEVSRLAAILKTLCSLKNFMEQKKLEDLCRSSTYGSGYAK